MLCHAVMLYQAFVLASKRQSCFAGQYCLHLRGMADCKQDCRAAPTMGVLACYWEGEQVCSEVQKALRCKDVRAVAFGSVGMLSKLLRKQNQFGWCQASTSLVLLIINQGFLTRAMTVGVMLRPCRVLCVFS
eukprot:1157312-Pelagomonas_calceolata.AAC.9